MNYSVDVEILKEEFSGICHYTTVYIIAENETAKSILTFFHSFETQEYSVSP